MVAHDPFTGKTTRPTEVEISRTTDKDGNTTDKKVRFPNDPQIGMSRLHNRERPQTETSGYAQGGTSNPPDGQSGDPVWYSPDGAVEESAQPMFQRDREVNPAPYENNEGEALGAVETDGTAADTKAAAKASKPKKDS